MARGVYCPVCRSERTWVHAVRSLDDGSLAWDFRCLSCGVAFGTTGPKHGAEAEPPAPGQQVTDAVRRIIARLR